jgi:maltose/maltodextrin transport system substrate-binding protein
MFRTIKKLPAKYLHVLAIIIIRSFLFSVCLAQVSTFKNKTSFGEIALKESVVPIHPGEPGKPIFWNENAHQFVYAPAFNYKAVKDAAKYKYKIFSLTIQVLTVLKALFRTHR